jgi:putative transposase
VNHVVNNFPVSQRRACLLLEQPLSTQRLNPVAASNFEQTLRARLREIAAARPRYGYRRMHALLNREGFRVNHKRVQRLCRDEGLRVRVKKRKRARRGQSTIPSDRLCAARPNHVWALDFQFDQTSNCKVLKYLNITDEFSKEALAIEVKRSMSGDDIVTVLEALINIHGAPEFVRMDNGTEMTSNTVADWCRLRAADISFKDLGSPCQNAYVESFNGKLRDELLGVEIFTTLLEAKIMAVDYRQDYNQNRPHSSLGYMTPHEFKQNWHHNNQGLTTVLAH